MLKKTIIAGFALLIAAFAFQPVEKAEAKVKVHIGVGGGYGYDPYYDRRYIPRPRYYDPDPYYGGGYYVPPPRYRPRPRPRRYGRINCRTAKRIIRNNGYRSVRARDCSGRKYRFKARKRGRWYSIGILSRNGVIYSVKRL